MLHGNAVTLRLARADEVGTLYELMSNLDARGSYFPLGVQSLPTLQADYDKNGFWDKEEGMLVITDADDQIVGEIEYFPITYYLQGYELSYQLFDPKHHGKGYTSTAVNLLVRYLFARKRVDRLQLNIHPDNGPSRRVAEKCGFTFEGRMRGCWFHHGVFHDLEIWSILRNEVPADQDTESLS